MVPLEVIHPLNLVFLLACHALLVGAFVKRDPDLRTFALLLSLGSLGPLIDIPSASRPTFYVVADLLMTALLTHIACARGRTWAILAAGFWFNSLVVSTAFFISERLGAGLNNTTFATAGGLWSYLAIGSAVYGLRSLRPEAKSRGTDDRDLQNPADGLPEVVRVAA